MAGKSLRNEKDEEPLICKSIQYELAILFAHYPPKVFNRNLKDLIVDYLTNDPDPESLRYGNSNTRGLEADESS